jgi:hypothetical protein
MDEVLNVITIDNIAFWLSGGSLVVAFASLVIALMAKKQARQAALLMSRTEAIAHLRQALADLTRNGLATAKTIDSIQGALGSIPSRIRQRGQERRRAGIHFCTTRATGPGHGQRNRYAERRPLEANCADEGRSGFCCLCRSGRLDVVIFAAVTNTHSRRYMIRHMAMLAISLGR